MIHFVIALRYIQKLVGRPPTKSLLEIIDLPLRECVDGSL